MVLYEKKKINVTFLISKLLSNNMDQLEIIPGRYCCFKNHFKPVTHVIFDLDGTIVNSDLIDLKVFKEIVGQFGQVYTEELHLAVLGMMQDDALSMIINKLNLEIELEEFKKIYQEKSMKLIANVEFLPGVIELINHLYDQQIPLAIATGSSSEAVDLKFSKQKDLYNKFNHVVCGESDPEVLQGKPKPNIFYVAARRFPDRPRRNKCLVFEDSFNGVRAALGAGMQVVMIPNKSMSYDKWKYATMRLDSLKQFIPELFGLPAFGSPVPPPKQKVELRTPAESSQNKETGIRVTDY